MSLTDRDRKVLIFVVPFLAIMGYWFLLLSPQRQEASIAAEQVVKEHERRDMAQAQLDTAKNAKQDFSADYTQIVRLGKAIPASVDMPSLIVQLDSAAAGTGISFTKIKTGERVDPALATTAPGATPPGTTPPADPATAAAAGGEQAQSAPGGAAEAANTTAQTANGQAAATDAQTSTSPGPAGTAPAAPAGLETVPLEMEFTGNFFNLADFFHRVKRFVEVDGGGVVVSGRLLTVEGVRWTSDPEIFPKIRAEMKATVYLSPKAQGATAGATPTGPSTTTPATTTTPAPGVAPTATATP